MRSMLNYARDAVGAAADNPTTADLPGVKSVAALVKKDDASKLTMQEQLSGLAKSGGAGIVGGVAGALIWKNHPVLGIIAGASAGISAPLLLKKEHRALAVTSLASDAGAVGGALLWKKHPVIGFILGSLIAGSVADYAVEQSAVQKVLGL